MTEIENLVKNEEDMKKKLEDLQNLITEGLDDKSCKFEFCSMKFCVERYRDETVLCAWVWKKENFSGRRWESIVTLATDASIKTIALGLLDTVYCHAKICFFYENDNNEVRYFETLAEMARGEFGEKFFKDAPYKIA